VWRAFPIGKSRKLMILSLAISHAASEWLAADSSRPSVVKDGGHVAYWKP